MAIDFKNGVLVRTGLFKRRLLRWDVTEYEDLPGGWLFGQRWGITSELGEDGQVAAYWFSNGNGISGHLDVKRRLIRELGEPSSQGEDWACWQAQDEIFIQSRYTEIAMASYSNSLAIYRKSNC